MQYVALIRGIGPRNSNMSNSNLCRVIESVGCHNVRSVITSGNILFVSSKNASALEKEISSALQVQLNIPGKTLVRSQKELALLIAAKPFDNEVHTSRSYLSVTFFAETSSRKPVDHSGVVVKRLSEREICIISNAEIIPGPKIMALLQKTYGSDITTRTWKTVERIVNKMEETT